MANWDAYKGKLAVLRDHWDKAEADVKLAEQVCNNVVFPSVKELRYAGRRLVEILHKIDDEANKDIVEGLLQDALFDCLRARHDAVDAATAQIAVTLDLAAEKLGYDVITQTFHKFTELRAKLNSVRSKIVESRGNRSNREAIYSVVETIDFPQFVALFSEFQESEPIMVELAKSARRTKLKNDVFGYIGIAGFIVGVIGIVLGYLALS